MTAAATTPLAARRDALDALAVATLLTCCTLWGLNQVATKVALADVPPLMQSAIRSLGAAALLMGFATWRGVGMFGRDGTLAAGIVAGALFAAEFGCIFVGLQYTAASRMVVFIYLAPFVVAFGMPFIARTERSSPLQWAGLGAAFGGVALAFSEGFGAAAAGPRQWFGDLLGVIAALLWGATTLVIRSTRLNHAAPEKTLLYQLAVSGVLLAAAAWVAGEPWPQRVRPLAAGAIAFQTVVVTFASYLAWFWLVRHYPATRISSFTLLTPVAGLAFGVALLGEPLTARLAVGLVAVAAGLWAVSRR
jgi:drug/metabolite transporter (DMT)-like permease